jgi:hypothetical protein
MALRAKACPMGMNKRIRTLISIPNHFQEVFN